MSRNFLYSALAGGATISKNWWAQMAKAEQNYQKTMGAIL